MIVYRLSKSKFASDLSGKGAEIAGGRWNSKGTALLYTSRSRALCTVEIAVHTPLGEIPDDYSILTIEIPDYLMHAIDPVELPNNWKDFPYQRNIQKIGDMFVVENKYLTLKAPSAVVQGEFNFLINPNHSHFPKSSC